MLITARLEEATVRQVIAELLPVTILLDEKEGLEGRWMKVNAAHHLDFVVGQGVRLGTSGELRWTIGPVPVSLTVHELVVMVRPVIVGEGNHGRLLFLLSIERADLSNVPELFDRGIVGLFNRQLEGRGDHLAWDFGRALGRHFGLPETLLPLEAARIGVEGARLEVRNDAIELTVALAMNITRE